MHKSMYGKIKARQSTRMKLSMSFKSLDKPPPLLSNKIGTWAFDTMSRRIREEILQGLVMKDNESLLSQDHRKSLEELNQELKHADQSQLREIKEDGGPDVQTWNHIISEYLESNWLDTPWVITEYYFYRRILESISYFKENGIGDPFAKQKSQGLNSSIPAIRSLSKLLNKANLSDDIEQNFRLLVLTSLWGNRMDLSIWPAEAKSDPDSADRAKDAISEVLKSSTEKLLADELSSVWSKVKDKGHQMDIVADNAGFELISDLALADYLVTSGLCEKVVIHLKKYPVFVSDAMEKDLVHHVEKLAGSDEIELQGLGKRWQQLLGSGKWELKEHNFWVLPLPFWDIPEDLQNHFSNSSMVFVKGDANYRRVLGELTWPFSTSFQEITSYWPAPLCCLRTMKSEIACGITEEREEYARSNDANWLVSGQFGVIQAKCD